MWRRIGGALPVRGRFDIYRACRDAAPFVAWWRASSDRRARPRRRAQSLLGWGNLSMGPIGLTHVVHIGRRSARAGQPREAMPWHSSAPIRSDKGA